MIKNLMLGTFNFNIRIVCLKRQENGPMKSVKITKILFSRTFFYIVLIGIVGVYVYRDHGRVIKDAQTVKLLFYNVKSISERDAKTLIIEFNSNENLLVKDGETKAVKIVVHIPSLDDFFFDQNRVVFTNGMPAKHLTTNNVGTILLKSSLGFKKRLKVDPEGVVKEISETDNGGSI